MNKRIKAFVILASISFILLGILVRLFPHSTLDIYISKEVQEEVDEKRAFDISRPLTYVSIFGNDQISGICVLAVAFAFFIFHYRKESLFVLFVFIADALNLLLKIMINRPRPTPELVHVAEKFNHSSFPSGHVVHYVVFFGFLLIVLLHKKLFILPLRVALSIFLILLILTIPISRVYLGAHWMTDVLGGYLVGFIFLSLLGGFYLKTSEI